MLYQIDCTARINAQDPTYPTYKAVDCTAHMTANNTGFHGALVDCTATITSLIVTACRSYNQGIRLVITIDDVNVSASLVGSLNIQHDKNQISDVTLYLGDTEYSPRTNSHIKIDKVIVITAYINGQEKKLFTGTLDEPSAENTPDFLVTITARDYGKKLLDKKTTVVSVQDLADTTKRNDLIKYLASVASVTDVDIPEMDAVTIDNSFTHQTVWDMIQKEAMVELYWIKFDEEGNLKLLLDEVKSDIELYPSPDWTYTENRITRLGYKNGRVEINKIIVLGKTDSSIIQNWDESALSISESITFTATENIADYTANIGGFRVTAHQSANWGSYKGYQIEFRIAENDIGLIYFDDLEGTIEVTEGGGTENAAQPNITFFDGMQYGLGSNVYTVKINIYADKPRVQCSINFTIIGKKYTQSLDTRYDQISASVTDPNSIIKYGERDGGSIEYPLLETEAQCTAVGEKIIRDSHRLLGQTDFNIPFNPLVETGQTILITDTKIGVNERYYIESVNHNVSFGDGKVNAETVLGGVLYV